MREPKYLFMALQELHIAQSQKRLPDNKKTNYNSAIDESLDKLLINRNITKKEIYLLDKMIKKERMLTQSDILSRKILNALECNNFLPMSIAKDLLLSLRDKADAMNSSDKNTRQNALEELP